VSAGNNVVFIGSYNWLSVMNEIFGFQLMSDYKVWKKNLIKRTEQMCMHMQQLVSHVADTECIVTRHAHSFQTVNDEVEDAKVSMFPHRMMRFCMYGP
jgi:hypothetical protein